MIYTVNHCGIEPQEEIEFQEKYKAPLKTVQWLSLELGYHFDLDNAHLSDSLRQEFKDNDSAMVHSIYHVSSSRFSLVV